MGLSRIYWPPTTAFLRENFSNKLVLTCSKSEISFRRALKMSSHFSERSSIKNCSVVLKPLDEKLLKNYVEKFNLKAEPQNGEADKTGHSQSKSSEGTNKRTQNFSKRRRKRRIKPLCYSDDGNCLKDKNIFKLPDIKHCHLPELKTSERSEEKGRMVWLESVQGNLVSCKENSEVDREIEIIMEFPKPVTRPMLTRKVSDQVEKLDEDEFEEREDGEDDRSTVIFEEELHKGVELGEVFREKEVIGKQMKNREITNRKKQRLVKFKRKRMAGWKSAKYKKPKSKVLENVQDPSEKLVECVNEEDLMEVCSSVKGLHDLCGIIQQLQGELSKFSDTELAIHFAKVIHAEQENFHKELKRSQKIIMKCYDKMLNVYNDTKRVAYEISKRTSLGVEDVVHIISRCILIEGHCDVDKPRSNLTEKAGSRQHRTLCEISPGMNRSQMTTSMSEKSAVGGSLTTQYQGCGIQPVEYAQGPNYTLHEPPAVPSGLGNSRRWGGEIQKKQKLKNCDSKTISGQLSQGFHSSESILRRMLKSYPSGANSTHQCNVNILIQRPQCQPPSFVPVSPVLTSVYPHPFHWYNEPTVANTSQSCGISGPVALVNSQIQTAQNGMRPVNVIPTTSGRLSSQTRAFQAPVELPERNNGSEMSETRNSEESGVLDPTIPQKLTMWNCRLQAGPVLDDQNDSPKESGESAQGSNPEEDSLEQKNARVYVCAQNDCKNPGIKICSFCRSVIYCSGTCQLKHWNQKHNVECYQLKKLRG